MPSDYDAVLLDAGGVLLLPDPVAIRTALAPFGIDPDDEACAKCHYIWAREFDRLGGVLEITMDRAVAAALGVMEAELDRAAQLLGPITESVPGAGVLDALRALERTGAMLGIVSNSNGTVERRLGDLGVCSVDGSRGVQVGVIVDSTVVGVAKPDPRIFEIALEALGVSRQRALYVGDTICKDVRGALAAGLHPLHLDPFSLCHDGSHDHVASIAGVAELLA